jgi:hypothetical protein
MRIDSGPAHFQAHASASWVGVLGQDRDVILAELEVRLRARGLRVSGLSEPQPYYLQAEQPPGEASFILQTVGAVEAGESQASALAPQPGTLTVSALTACHSPQ